MPGWKVAQASPKTTLHRAGAFPPDYPDRLTQHKWKIPINFSPRQMAPRHMALRTNGQPDICHPAIYTRANWYPGKRHQGMCRCTPDDWSNNSILISIQMLVLCAKENYYHLLFITSQRVSTIIFSSFEEDPCIIQRGGRLHLPCKGLLGRPDAVPQGVRNGEEQLSPRHSLSFTPPIPGLPSSISESVQAGGSVCVLWHNYP